MNDNLNSELSRNTHANKQLISIITDNFGNIIVNNSKFFPFLKLTLINLQLQPNQKKLLVNMLDKNYLICKIPFEIKTYPYCQYVFEEWRMGNDFNQILSNTLKKQIKINENVFTYESFSTFEQEIIHSLLSGYTTDKEIESYLKKFISKKTKGNIKYTISMLYLRFNTCSRTDLIKLLKLYELDKYLPISLFPPGIYDL